MLFLFLFGIFGTLAHLARFFLPAGIGVSPQHVGRKHQNMRLSSKNLPNEPRSSFAVWKDLPFEVSAPFSRFRSLTKVITLS